MVSTVVSTAQRGPPPSKHQRELSPQYSTQYPEYLDSSEYSNTPETLTDELRCLLTVLTTLRGGLTVFLTALQRGPAGVHGASFRNRIPRILINNSKILRWGRASAVYRAADRLPGLRASCHGAVSVGILVVFYLKKPV